MDRVRRFIQRHAARYRPFYSIARTAFEILEALPLNDSLPYMSDFVLIYSGLRLSSFYEPDVKLAASQTTRVHFTILLIAVLCMLLGWLVFTPNKVILSYLADNFIETANDEGHYIYAFAFFILVLGLLLVYINNSKQGLQQIKYWRFFQFVYDRDPTVVLLRYLSLRTLINVWKKGLYSLWILKTSFFSSTNFIIMVDL